MLRKILTIVVFLTLILSFVPQEAFCSDHEDPAQAHHHCAFTCNACSSMIVTTSELPQQHFQISALKFRYQFAYQNPIIARLKRPPIQIS